MTFMRYFYVGATLRRIMNTVNWPDLPEYRTWFAAFQRTFRELVRGTRVTDALNFDFLYSPSCDTGRHLNPQAESTLPRDVYDTIVSLVNDTSNPAQFASAYARGRRSDDLVYLPTKGQFVKNVTHGGVKYTSDGRDSFVTYKLRTNEGEVVNAGKIQGIFLHHRRDGGMAIDEVFIILRDYLPLTQSDRRHDPFHSFEGLDTRLYYNAFHGKARIIRIGDVVAHFASLIYTPPGMDTECLVVRSLDRVRGILVDVRGGLLTNDRIHRAEMGRGYVSLA